MRWFHGVLVSFLFGVLVAACTTVDPSECWPNTSGGLGGGPETIPIGAGVGATSSGDFITPPPYDSLGHEDDANPCIEPQGPCSQKCLTDYENRAAECGAIGDAGERRACQDGAFASYKSCREGCVQSGGDCLELCREQCDKANVKCVKDCTKGDIPCMAKCNEANGRCLKECSKRCK